jgi:hypothetical protein
MENSDSPMRSLEKLIQSSSRALVVGVGGGGDIVGALATARFLEFCGVEFILGGLSWERPDIDPVPGPRSVEEVKGIRLLHQYAWLADSQTKTAGGVAFAESRMATFLGRDILLLDINGGVRGIVEGLKIAATELKADMLIGIDVGGDSLARGTEPGLYSPLADSIMLAAWKEMEGLGWRTLWGVFGYGSDGELSVEEIERILSDLAKAGGLIGAWALTQPVVSELELVIQAIPTEASAIPVKCARGAWGETRIRRGQRSVKLTPLATITFFLSPTVLFQTISRPAQALAASSSLEEANEALHAIGLKTELDVEREAH